MLMYAYLTVMLRDLGDSLRGYAAAAEVKQQTGGPH